MDISVEHTDFRTIQIQYKLNWVKINRNKLRTGN
jgi:hypothetical protein